MTAHEEGAAARAAGKQAEDNPYPVDSKEYDEWWAGFTDLAPMKKKAAKTERMLDAPNLGGRETAREILRRGGLPRTPPPEVR